MTPAAPGRLVERYSYDPYGRVLIESCTAEDFDCPREAGAVGGAGEGSGSSGWTALPVSRYGNPYLFTGQRHDATVGLHHFFARTYDPRLGRWLTSARLTGPRG